MKKKLFAAFAATLAGATLALSACTSGDSKIAFVNHWDLNTELTDVTPTHETLVYDVSFTPGNSSFINYELDYNGTYITKLDWETDEEYWTPDGEKGWRGDKSYKFTSALHMTATFTTANGKERVSDYVYTEVIFHQAGGTNNLYPVYSTKTILCHSPKSISNAVNPSDCYTPYYYEITTDYTDGTGTCKVISRPVDTTAKVHVPKPNEVSSEENYVFSAYNSKRNVLDNEQFPVAFRAMPAGTSSKVQMFNPFVGHSQNYTVSLSSDVQEGVYKYSLNGTPEKERTIKYLTASIAVDGTSSGLPQSAEIAALTNSTSNQFRNVMLRYSTPLAYNMGTIVYELKSATYKTFENNDTVNNDGNDNSESVDSSENSESVNSSESNDSIEN